MSNSFKSFLQSCTRCLPASWRQRIRRTYYLKVVKAYQESSWEWTPVIKNVVPAGGHVLDIGANVGYLSKLFAGWVGPSGRVISIEPIPDTFAALKNSMNQLFAETVTPIACCMSNQPGSVRMVVPTYEKGGENFYESHIDSGEPGASNGRAFNVPASTIDLVCRDNNLQPDFIKIDVEGHELSVVRGGESVLTARHPPLLIEVAGNPDDPTSAANEMFRLLRNWGYVPLILENGQCRARKTGDKAVDYFFISENRGLK